jgi:nucleotide-binding universal stress UspA family protein
MIYKKILVLLDGSSESEVVFDYARELAGRLSLDVDFLHVCSPNEASQLPMRKAYVDNMARDLKIQSEAIRNKAGYKPRDEEIQVKGYVEVGYPADEILKFADTHQSDIIMLTSSNRKETRWGLGGVTEKVIHAAKVPIWLVPSELRLDVILDRISKRTIVIPLNGSEKSETVVPYALALAKQRGAETAFVILSVSPVEKVPVSTGETKGVFLHDLLEGSRVDKEVYINQMAKKIQAEGFEATAVHLHGVPTEEIIKYISTHPTQLLAMATNGASSLTEWLFSNVCEKIVRSVKKTPIFLVRPK